MSIDLSGGNENMDYAQLEHTYKGFIFLTKIAVVSMIVLLVGMYLFLT